MEVTKMELDLITLAGKPAAVGLVATVIAMYLFRRPTVAIFCGVLAGLASLAV
jgi:ABC-type thiamin/hydroxymethylpyrimidine transport system permease subunit